MRWPLNAALPVLVLLATLAAKSAVAALEIHEGPPPSSIELLETPLLVPEVSSGELPPVDLRVPARPYIMSTDGERSLGQPGGELKTLIASAKDTRLLVVYGYARLIGYDENLNLVPDILERVEVESGQRRAEGIRRSGSGRATRARDEREQAGRSRDRHRSLHVVTSKPRWLRASRKSSTDSERSVAAFGRG